MENLDVSSIRVALVNYIGSPHNIQGSPLGNLQTKTKGRPIIAWNA